MSAAIQEAHKLCICHYHITLCFSFAHCGFDQLPDGVTAQCYLKALLFVIC